MEPQTSTTTEEWEQLLGGAIRQLRKRRRLTQAELAAQANVSLSSIRSLEHGRGSTLTTLVRVTRALGRTEWLSTFTPEEPTVSPVKLLREREKQAEKLRSRVRHSTTS
jgi:transcriptional regulator with XRE-family HTH domain